MLEIPSVDVAVIGGGPAGLAAAIAARRLGFSTAVFDSAEPPIDKACGEGLLPEARAALAGLGVSIPADCGYEMQGIRFLGENGSVQAAFPGQRALGLRRTALHSLLAAHAAEAGVNLSWGTPVTAISVDGIWTGDRRILTRWIVGADGAQSAVRRWAGLDKSLRFRQRFGFRRHYRIEPWTDFVEVYWQPDCQLYITPVASSEVGIAVLSADPHFRLDQALELFPEVADRLKRGFMSSSERGGISATHRLPDASRGSIALVGDASGSVDAITGEGLGLAFQQAIALADSLTQATLEPYSIAHREIGKRPEMMADLLLSVENRPRLLRGMLRMLQREPWIFQQMLAFHVGAPSQLDFAARGLALGSRALHFGT